MAKQYGGYVAVDGLTVNGELTLGENIADLGGLRIAYVALEKTLAGKPAKKIDGYTPEQRFFLSYAQIWRGLMRPEALRVYVLTNPHSPAQFPRAGADVQHAGVLQGVRRFAGAGQGARQPQAGPHLVGFRAGGRSYLESPSRARRSIFSSIRTLIPTNPH